MNDGTLVLGRFFGIPLKLHWTFALLIAYVLFNVIVNDSMAFLWYVAFLFACVVFHEYGHALMAKRYKIITKDIILSPIGGVARLENLPEKPLQEMAIALAGPMVNLIFALGLFLILKSRGDDFSLPQNNINSVVGINDYLFTGMLINVALFLFNLVPAFPMDGGRVLRALLAWKLGRSKGTKIATQVGRLLALVFILIGIYYQEYMLAFVGVFIIMMARVELNEVLMVEKLSKLMVRDFMRIDFTKLHIGDPIESAILKYKHEGEGNFVVFDSLNYVAGTIPSQFIAKANSDDAHSDQVSKWMSDKIVYTTEDTTLKTVFEIMNKQGVAIMIVGDQNSITGVIDREAVLRALNVF